MADWPFEVRQLNHYAALPYITTHNFSLPTEIGNDRPGFIAPPQLLARKLNGLKPYFS